MAEYEYEYEKTGIAFESSIYLVVISEECRKKSELRVKNADRQLSPAASTGWFLTTVDIGAGRLLSD